jgi:peptidoglycan/xylan/chitin deacetylase (PgdA/CDA1 family)
VVSAPSRVRSLTSKSVKQVLHHLGLTVRHVRRLKANFIIMFHLVPPCESARLENTIRFLSDSFPIVRLDELLDRIQGKSQAQEGVVALTFDDGLWNHGEVVYAVLKRLSVPATFYICSDMIDRPGSIWTWEILSRLRRLSPTAQKRFYEAAGVTDDLQKIVDWMKTIPVDRREHIEEEIHDCTPGFQFTPLEQDRFGLMSWRQIQNLDPNLITIGSHTATHVDLPQADPERLVRELSRGKEILESQLNRKVEHFAYPNGNFNQQVLPLVKKYYSSAVTTRSGMVKTGDNPLLLNRIHAEFDLARFSWELASNARREPRS